MAPRSSRSTPSRRRRPAPAATSEMAHWDPLTTPEGALARLFWSATRQAGGLSGAIARAISA
eukprot:5794468-Pyramimonas_sp.AAC.1